MKVKDIEKRRQRAEENNRGVKATLTDLYRYVLPYRRPANGNSVPGERSASGGRTDHIFDSTAPKAAFRFAGRMMQEITPPFQQFFELKTGPFLQTGDDDERKAVDEALEQIQKLIGGVIEGSNFAVSMGEMYLDLFGGTGALLMNKHKTNVMDFIAVPMSEIHLRENGSGKVTGIYWDKQFEAGELPDMWDDPKFPDTIQQAIKDDPGRLIRVIQATEQDSKTGKWVFTAYLPEHTDQLAIYTNEERTNPWLTPRFYKISGEAMGRGPGIMGLPVTKTLNKVTQLTVMAASLAILGLWTYRNDRKFNPRTARLAPGAMWAVGSNGGPMGPSVQKLDVPGRFDVSNLVLQELRMQAKEVMLDDTLPPDGASVRSATEIVERMKRLSLDLQGAYARLVLEIIIPLIERIIDVLDQRKLIPAAITIDQLLYKVQIVSPVARAQQASQVQSIVEWLQIILGLGGQEMMLMTARVEQIFSDMGQKLGVSEKYIRSDADKQQIQQLVAQIMANAQAAAQQAAGGQPPDAMAGGGEPSTQQGARADLLTN